MASIITPYERHLIFSYLHNLVARVGDRHLLQATAREHLPEWIVEHAAGVNILLYGAPGTGKTEFTKVLAARLGVNLFSIGDSDDDGDEPSRLERLQELKMAHLLARDRKSLLLFDEMEDLLASEGDRFALPPLFSSPARGSEGSKVFLNRVLEKSPVPTIWIMNDARAVSPVILRRMMFALELRLPPAAVRTSIWQRQLDRHAIATSSGAAAALAREFPVAPGVAEGAIGAAALTGGGVETVRRGVHSLLRVLPRESTARDAEPPERYEPALTRADTDLRRLADQLVASESRCSPTAAVRTATGRSPR